MDGVVNEVTAGEVFEEEMAEVDKVSDVSCSSPLPPPPLEEGVGGTCCIEEKTTFYGSRGSARRSPQTC